MNIMLFRGVLLGAGFSVATLVIFYRSVIAVVGGGPSIIAFRPFAVWFLGGMGIGFVGVIVALIVAYRVLRVIFAA